MLYAITFVVHDCGFKARRVRTDNILGLIRDYRFGIHDILRTEIAIRNVRDWLDSSPVDPEIIRPGGGEIFECYQWLMDELPELCEEVFLDPDELTYNNFTTLLVEWLRFHEW